MNTQWTFYLHAPKCRVIKNGNLQHSSSRNSTNDLSLFPASSEILLELIILPAPNLNRERIKPYTITAPTQLYELYGVGCFLLYDMEFLINVQLFWLLCSVCEIMVCHPLSHTPKITVKQNNNTWLHKTQLSKRRC